MDFPKYVRKSFIFVDEKDPLNGLRANEIAGQNIVMRLAGRELWGGFGRREGTERYLQRSMYQSIYPNFTVTTVAYRCFLKNFTLDGKYLVAFSGDQMSVEVYYFKGPQAANHLFIQMGKEWEKSITSDIGGISPEQYCSFTQTARTLEDSYRRTFPESPYWQDLSRNIFDSFFRLKFRLRVAATGEKLNMSCSLFTSDFRYLIVGSETLDIGRENTYYEFYRNNESIEPKANSPLQNYTIHIIDMAVPNGRVTDRKCFKNDKIFLYYNTGIYLLGNTLSILSTQHQTITVLRVENGKFLPLRTIGRFCYEDDESICSRYMTFHEVHPKNEAFFNTLKQRLLTYLFKQAHSIANDPDSPDSFYLCRFYKDFEKLVNLRLWKMQLLDEDHLLLKYSVKDVVTLRPEHDTDLQSFVSVIYCISSTEILAAFENTTEVSPDICKRFADNFINKLTIYGRCFASLYSNNSYTVDAKQMYPKIPNSVLSARLGGSVAAAKKLSKGMPMKCQSSIASPYLDKALFSFGKYRVSSVERLKDFGEIPIRFFGQDSMIYKFQILAGTPMMTIPRIRGNQPMQFIDQQAQFASFIFHPSAPFAISIQRSQTANHNRYTYNFHLRVDPHSVLPLR